MSIVCRRCGKNGFVYIVNLTREASKNGASVKTRNTRADAKIRYERCVYTNTKYLYKYLLKLFSRFSSSYKRAKD